jgi:N-acetylmuramoyl-L-alanine amidase
MTAERMAVCPQIGERAIEELSARLLALAGDQSVRVIEALAAVYANQIRSRSVTWGLGEDAQPYRALPPTDLWIGDPAPACDDSRHGVCRRIARRAVRGSLVDPTGGAVAFHRIDANPSWARDQLPIACVGPFLFYGS